MIEARDEKTKAILPPEQKVIFIYCNVRTTEILLLQKQGPLALWKSNMYHINRKNRPWYVPLSYHNIRG